MRIVPTVMKLPAASAINITIRLDADQILHHFQLLDDCFPLITQNSGTTLDKVNAVHVESGYTEMIHIKSRSGTSEANIDVA